jgi:glycogen operon protein
MMRSVVVSPYFEWGDDRPPRIPYHDMVIYEAHVKGLTARHPGVPAELRGTYAGLGHPAIIEHLTDLGVNAVELLPVHQFVHDRRLLKRGLRDYWGYNAIGFFAPHNEYSSEGERGEQVLEFKAMVRALHEAGIEVILDHTAERPPGADAVVPRHRQRLLLPPGGRRPPVLRRHRRRERPADAQPPRAPTDHGLAAVLGDGDARRRVPLRPGPGAGPRAAEADRLAAFLDLVRQDPVVSQVKLIAEPWDVGEGGYQVGDFPPLQTFLNGATVSEPVRRGRRIADDSFLPLFNAHAGDAAFRVPPVRYGEGWAKVLDTATPCWRRRRPP